jgi:hypothetical protein
MAGNQASVDEGITGRDSGYNLVATTSGGAAFVSVNRVANEYATAKWTPLNYPGSTMTTGNTSTKTMHWEFSSAGVDSRWRTATWPTLKR